MLKALILRFDLFSVVFTVIDVTATECWNRIAGFRILALTYYAYRKQISISGRKTTSHDLSRLLPPAYKDGRPVLETWLILHADTKSHRHGWGGLGTTCSHPGLKKHFLKHRILQRLRGKWIMLRMKMDRREKNKTVCFVAALEEWRTRSGLQRVIFPNQSSLMDSLPQERKKSQESENSGQKKSLQTK